MVGAGAGISGLQYVLYLLYMIYWSKSQTYTVASAQTRDRCGFYVKIKINLGVKTTPLRLKNKGFQLLIYYYLLFYNLFIIKN